MDFSKYVKTTTFYGGSEKKFGIMINEREYILKFRKIDSFMTRNNHYSEFIGSHIFAMLGFLTQETYLGTYHDEEIVACKNFLSEGQQFVPFNDIGESSLERDKQVYSYSYSDIMDMLKENKKLTNVEEAIDQFWEVFIVDALIGNFDRHGHNWGFIKTKGIYHMAPIFDNGACLFPKLVNGEDMEMVMNSMEESDKRVFKFPTSQILLNGKKSSYYDIIASMQFTECNHALKKICERINIIEIKQFINSIEMLSTLQKQFYLYMIQERYEKILLHTYDKLL